MTGMNQFLAQLRITFRRDPTNYRPRINKADSVKDREQKANGNFFFMDNDDILMVRVRPEREREGVCS